MLESKDNKKSKTNLSKDVDKAVNLHPEEEKKQKKNRKTMLMISVGLLILALIVGGVIYVSLKSDPSDSASTDSTAEGTISEDEIAAIKARDNSQRGSSAPGRLKKIEILEQGLLELDEGSQEWVVKKYEVAAQYFLINEIEEATNANSVGLIAAKKLGDEQMISKLEEQKEMIISSQESLEAFQKATTNE